MPLFSRSPYSSSDATRFSTRLSVTLIALGAFALGVASYVTAGLIPLITQELFIPEAAAAQLVTAFTLAYAVGSPVVVALLPGRFQREGLIAALVVFVLANALCAVSTSFIALLIWRSAAGVAAGVYLALGIAAAGALSREERRGQALAMIMGGMASGTVLGVPLGLALAERLGWAAAFWLVAALGAIATIGLFIKLPCLPAPAPTPLRQKLAILKHPATLGILSVSLLAAIASLGMYTFIAPFMAVPAFGGVSSIALYLWVWGVGGIAGSFLIGPFVDRYLEARVTLVIMLVLTTALIALPLAAIQHPLMALLPIALWGAVGWALQVPQNNRLMQVRAPFGDAHLAVALNESALYLGSALGAGAGGLILAGGLSPWHLALAAAGAAALGAFLQLLLVARAHRR
ncbi:MULTISPECIES: MFS transporter [unclassified Halomonas]|uniref:MFS transporter n=1 Tax=unclassified Halomonas TaxID=2609666 RepID=UPI002076AA37|nr:MULTISPECIES: MFS transporter [unclassified Halomonas]